MTELHFLRHAHAGDPETWVGSDDLRPLSEKGERQDRIEQTKNPDQPMGLAAEKPGRQGTPGQQDDEKKQHRPARYRPKTLFDQQVTI